MDYQRKFHKATGMPTSWLDLLRWTLSSLLPCSESTAPVRGSTLTLSAPFSNQLSSRVPLPLPATPRFQIQKPFVWFRAKTDKGIVCLAGHLYSVTIYLGGLDMTRNCPRWWIFCSGALGSMKTLSLPLLPGPLRPRLGQSVKFPSIHPINLFKDD